MSLEDKLKNAEETMWPMTMGMTTKKAIEHLLDIMDSMPDDACGDWRDSLAYAIETLNKYQKIEQIIRNYDVTWEFHHMKSTIDKIREAIKDGNDK